MRDRTEDIIAQIDLQIRAFEEALKRLQIARAHIQATRSAAAENNDTLVSICSEYGITMEELLGSSRRSEYVRARRAAMRALKNEGKTLSEIGRILKRHHSTISVELRKYDEGN
jgi:chromosomal replication initiation ATPase DnaA